MENFNQKTFEFRLLMAIKNWIVDRNCVSIDYDAPEIKAFLKDYWILYDLYQINNQHNIKFDQKSTT